MAEVCRRPAASPNDAKGTQYARLVMAHVDCNTVPFMWPWATRFTIFDNMFATEDGPSTPNAIALIAGQSGESQWVKHPNIGSVRPGEYVFGNDGPSGGTITVGNEHGENADSGADPGGDAPQPFYGSRVDRYDRGPQSDQLSTSDGCGTYSVASKKPTRPCR